MTGESHALDHLRHSPHPLGSGFLRAACGGGLIHLLLVVAAVVLIYQLVTGRRVV